MRGRDPAHGVPRPRERRSHLAVTLGAEFAVCGDAEFSADLTHAVHQSSRSIGDGRTCVEVIPLKTADSALAPCQRGRRQSTVSGEQAINLASGFALNVKSFDPQVIRAGSRHDAEAIRESVA